MKRREALVAIPSLALFVAGASNNKKIVKMIKRKIPKSGEELAVVGVGTWQTFDVQSTVENLKPLEEIVMLMMKHGSQVIDSSPMYGRSETVVGEILKKFNARKSIFCATKVWTNGRETGIKQMEKSMTLMTADPIDLMQIHNLIDWKTHLPVLRKWKEEGRIKYIGITHYHESAYESVENLLRKESLDFLQINYSIRHRDAEKVILPLAQDKGVAVLVSQPFESGTLFSLVKGKTLPEWVIKDLGCSTWGQFFLKFILADETVTCVIPGTSKPKHFLDNISAGVGFLPTKESRDKMVKLIKSV